MDLAIFQVKAGHCVLAHFFGAQVPKYFLAVQAGALFSHLGCAIS